MARKLRWLGPGIVLVGVAVAVLGLFVMLRGRPKVGDVIDTIKVDDHTQVVVRAEQGDGDRNFIEMIVDGELVWQAMVPTYAGRPGAPGIAVGSRLVSIRVIRDQRAEVFALARANAAKVGGFKLSPDKGPAIKQTVGPVTLYQDERSYEIVGGAGWNQLVAVDLPTGEGVWAVDLPGAPITGAGIEDGTIWIEQNNVRKRYQLTDGHDRTVILQTPARSSKSS